MNAGPRDGIYVVTLTVDGVEITGEVLIRDGVVQGRGKLAGLRGTVEMLESPAGPDDPPGGKPPTH